MCTSCKLRRLCHLMQVDPLCEGHPSSSVLLTKNGPRRALTCLTGSSSKFLHIHIHTLIQIQIHIQMQKHTKKYTSTRTHFCTHRRTQRAVNRPCLTYFFLVVRASCLSSPCYSLSLLSWPLSLSLFASASPRQMCTLIQT